MKKFQKVALCALLVLSLIIVTGCAQFDVNLRINQDKSADLNFVFMVSNMMVSIGDGKTGLEDIKKEAINQGFSAKDVKQNDMTGYKFSKHLASLENLQSGTNKNTKSATDSTAKANGKASIFTQPFESKNNSKLYEVKKGFFKDVYTFNTSLNLSDLAADKLNLGSNTDQMTTALLQNVIAQMDFNFNLELPVKTISNNATKVSADGKKLSWNLKAGDTNSIRLSFNAWNINRIIMAAAAILAVLIFLIALLIHSLKKRSRKKKLLGIDDDSEDALLPDSSDDDDDMFVADKADENRFEDDAQASATTDDAVDLLGEKMDRDVIEPLSHPDENKGSGEDKSE